LAGFRRCEIWIPDVFQINATIPTGVTPGDVPITVSIGGISTTRSVTIAVQ
jgi:uncharacterized protein (TIGR03437 family)